MEMTEHYANIEPSRADVDALEGPVLLEFGTAWCGHCRAAQPLIGKALDEGTLFSLGGALEKAADFKAKPAKWW